MKSIKIPSYKKVHVQFDYYVVELISVSKKLKEVRFISKPRRPKNDVITFQYSAAGFADALQCYEKGIIPIDPYHFWNTVRHFFMDHEFFTVDDLNH